MLSILSHTPTHLKNRIYAIYTRGKWERLSLPALHSFKLFQKLSFKIDHEVQHLLKSLEKKCVCVVLWTLPNRIHKMCSWLWLKGWLMPWTALWQALHTLKLLKNCCAVLTCTVKLLFSILHSCLCYSAMHLP